MAPRIVQWAGDLYDAAVAYIGAEREIRVDISNWDLLVHDGTTPGGHRLMNMTNADLRYQKLNSELGGLGPFPPGSRGLLVRASDTEYILRLIQQTPDNEVLVQNNPDGFNGNFVFSLADVFPRAKEFQNTVQFDQNVTMEASLSVAQNVNVAGVIQGGTFQGNFVFGAGSIPLSAIAGLDAHIQTLGCPIGAIMLWNHNYGGIPAGWHLCDGTAGTIDLRDRFVVGAGLDYGPAVVGGSTLINIGNVGNTYLTIDQMPNHNHAIVDNGHVHGVTDPGHAHVTPAGLVVQTGSGVNLGGAGGQFSTVTNEGTTNNTSNISIQNAGCNLGMNTTGGNDFHTHTTPNFDVRPPYYAEYYIQHIGP